MEIFENVMIALSGLSLFLVAIKLMSSSLKSITGKKTINVIKLLNKNPIVACIVGILFTTMIQSSDGAVALVIGLVAAGFLDLKTAIAFILGANIGTATTSIIVAASDVEAFNWVKYSIYAFSFIGAFGLLLFSNEKKIRVAMLMFSIGAIFTGLYVMSQGFTPLAHKMRGSLKGFTSPFLALFVSTIFTGMFQSSSAIVTVVQEFYAATKDVHGNWHQGLLSTKVALSMVIGANIGTTFTALIASIGNKNKDTKRIALVWLITNTVVAIIMMPIISFGNSPFSQLVTSANKTAVFNNEGLRMNSKFDLAIGHMFFNSFLVLLFLPLIRPLAFISKKIIKDGKKTKFKYEINLPKTLLYESPQIAYQSAKKAVVTLGKMQRDSILVLIEYIKNPSKEGYKDYRHLQNLIEKVRTNISLFLVELGSKIISGTISNRIMVLTLSMKAYDASAQIGGKFLNELSKSFDKKTSNLDLNENFKKEAIELLSIVASVSKRSYQTINRYAKKKHDEAAQMYNAFSNISESFRSNHIRRQQKNLNTEKVDVISLIVWLERILKHEVRIIGYQKSQRKTLERIHISEDLAKEISSLHK